MIVCRYSFCSIAPLKQNNDRGKKDYQNMGGGKENGEEGSQQRAQLQFGALEYRHYKNLAWVRVQRTFF